MLWVISITQIVLWEREKSLRFLMSGIKANCKKIKIGGNYGRRK
jgi:hypothetical protein